ncbi:helix-turn-helix domain-containing protein [bacterium]|nr:helix-turn-helix domain-containing protein [bacterium]
MPDSFKNRLLYAMQQNNVKAADLSKRTGLSKAQISQYVNGVYEAKQTALYKLAVALNVSEAWLMGHDVPMGRLLVSKNQEQTTMFEQIQLYFGSEAVEMMQLFVQLNDQGKQRAIESVSDLIEISKYTEKEDD